MNTGKLITGFLLLMLASACYKDKGNYDYKTVNNFEVTVTPAPSSIERNLYLINQPGTKAETFVVTANATQTQGTTEDNLEYTWYRTLYIEGEKKPTRDTITGKENQMELVAQKKTTYDLLLIVRDKTTDIEYYQNFTVKTKTPFTNAWLYIHGDAGARKIGALQWDINGKPEVIPDIMEKMGQPGYAHATGITYTAHGSEDFLKTERLFITSGQDSVTYVIPFTCKAKGRWQQMGLPGTVKIKDKIISPYMSERQLCGLIDSKGQVYFSNSWGTPNFSRPETKITNYKADQAYMDAEGNAILWDNTNKRLMFCSNGEYMEYAGGLKSNDLKNKEMLWLGRAPKMTNAAESEPILFIAKNMNNNKCYLYTISKGSGGDDKSLLTTKGKDEQENMLSSTVCDSIYTWNFDKSTLFATTNYFQDQLFYTAENTIYRATLASGESFKLYKPKEGTIKQIAFRLTNASRYIDSNTQIDYNIYQRVLAIIVTKADGTDEIHEIHLNNAGDVEAEHIYDLGQISILDWAYTGLHRDADAN